MRKPTYRMPDGKTYTDDVQKWSAAWEETFKPFEALGLRVLSFDPGIQVLPKDEPFMGQPVTLPNWFFQKLLPIIGQKCSCGDRLKSQCPGEWEPGCDLGSNEKHVKPGEGRQNLG